MFYIKIKYLSKFAFYFIRKGHSPVLTNSDTHLTIFFFLALSVKRMDRVCSARRCWPGPLGKQLVWSLISSTPGAIYCLGICVLKVAAVNERPRSGQAARALMSARFRCRAATLTQSAFYTITIV